MPTKDDFFVPENAETESRKEYDSPSGKYKLVVTPFRTREGAWTYTQGLVFKTGEDKPLAEVRRNYSSFDYEWVEGHLNGHDYLVCGEDYQGQTVIELDTSARRDYLPPEAKKGAGFCWVDAKFNRDHQLLVVGGCYWAAPYEFRLYDFSDPMNGWPHIGEDVDIALEGKPPTIAADGTMTTYETLEKGFIDGVDYVSENYDETPVVVATRTFKREGLKLVEIASWVDEAEVKRREESAALTKQYEQAWEEYKNNNPLYLRVMERGAVPPFKHESYSVSIGRCYSGWHPTEEFEDSRVCKRLLDKPRDEKGVMVSEGWTVDLEWGRNHAPVKLQLHKDGQCFNLDTLEKTDDRNVAKFFEHSVQGIDQALDLAASIVGKV